ncbi:coiled-coil domain-containing protein 181 [Anolis carolinensis]|uniref:Coiled-coil domain-containing protein 181 n=1 Tax=Anolis carolinensis TaxID=28377 RepID=G1KK94_ANOCA|nr:PREDICTED: coiled-coil domain-containing protein 181 [Anolis carolinensis]XP_008106059.1 PREDICTED: coiled-coil domain-containing protein 181 [Anolis carolinensis]XP_008106060.1 PREDICTED: coiled-coil domain-containing protein 181 [Anolis carolinensis]|eukprot:XP_008106057.1 PREDICTED: coiled-coil domain-containing protein 181 [Anolis carolinensis]
MSTMGDKKNTSKSSENGDTDGEEYEDDFEKDLEWLINEEEKRISGDIQNHDENEDDVDVESILGKDLVEGKEYTLNSSQEIFELERFVTGEDGSVSRKPPEDILKDKGSRNEIHSIYDFETKRLEQASDSESESSCQESKADQEDLEDDEDIKRYILDKIEEANKLLLCQEPLDETKERKLKFKDNLVDLEVPSLEVVGTDRGDLQGDKNISGRLSQLHISTNMEQEDISLSLNGGNDDEHKDGKILVERDGKFELLSIRDIESQGFFPPLSVSFSDIETQHISPKTSYSTSLGTICLTKDESLVQTPVTSSREGFIYVPQPPSIRPSSAINLSRNVDRRKSPRRVQSANVGLGTRSSTYCLSPRQKELQKQIEQRKEKLRKEEEIRKKRLEDQKKRENDMVFKAWLQKKKGQMQEEKRIQRAKELEDLSSRQESRNPEEAYRSWLKKKQEEQMRERHIQVLKQQEECMFYLPRTVENERAYKQWLRKKRREKREEQLAAKEHSKQLRQEARRAKQIENILCSISDPRSLRFTDQYS